MKIEKREDEIVVELENRRIKYGKKEWGEKQPFLTSEGSIRMKEWKIDLVKNYGVDLNELRSTD